jgi:hypothetical protein
MADETPRSFGDPVLAVLYSAVTSSGGEVGMSLLVGGTWVSGMLCSPRSWYEQVAHLVDQSTDGGFGLVFRELGRNIYPTDDEVEAGVAESRPDDRPIGFLHLRDARTVSTSGTVPTDMGGLLRLRIEQVDGWLVGNLGEPGYKTPAPLA